ADALREELDFGVELRSTALVASELAATPGVRVPRTYPQLSTARLLVMERMPGRPLGAAADLLAALGPQRRREIADALLGVVMGQVLRTGCSTSTCTRATCSSTTTARSRCSTSARSAGS